MLEKEAEKYRSSDVYSMPPTLQKATTTLQDMMWLDIDDADKNDRNSNRRNCCIR